MVDKDLIKSVKMFERSNKSFINFWERLDIALDDRLKSPYLNTNAIISQMFKSIRQQPELYVQLKKKDEIESTYTLPPRKRNEKLKEIFKQNIENILTPYFCTTFSQNFMYPDIWDANNVLTKTDLARLNGNLAARTFLTYNKNKSVLEDIYNNVVMLKSEQQKYEIILVPPFKGKLNISGKKFERLLNSYEKLRKTHRNKVMVWWEKDRGDEYDIVFRRSLSKNIRIRLFNKNKFMDAADTKTITLKKDLSELGFYTKKNRQLMLKFLTRIIKAQTQASSVELKTSPFFLSSTNAGKLLDNLIQNKGTRLRLVEATISNFPVKTNPEVKIKAINADGIEDALADFEKKTLSLDKNEIRTITVRYDGRDFVLRPEKKGSNIEFNVSGRGTQGEVKRLFLKELENTSRL